MSRNEGVALLLVFSLVGCGGKSTDPATASASHDEGGASVGRAGNGDDIAGSPSVSTPGGATSTSNGGGAPTQPSDCDPNAIDDSCVEGCGVDLLNLFTPMCADGVWVCAEGFVSLKACSEQSCARAQVSCCDAKLGTIESAPCVDGLRRECPPGAAALPPGPTACRPPGVSSCGGLSGACSDDALECHNGQRCDTSCTCDAGPDGSLVWVCLSPLC